MTFISSPPRTLLAVLTLAAAPSLSSAAIEVVYAAKAHAAASPKSLVPGPLGDSGVRFTNFNKVYSSLSGSRWVTAATTDIAVTSQDQVVLLGSGGTGTVAAQEGVTEFAPGSTIVLGIAVPRVNDAGEWALAFSIGATDGAVVRGSGSTVAAVARAGGSPPALGGDQYGVTFSTANIANGGAVGFVASGLAVSTTGLGNEAVLGADGGALVLRTALTVPTGQAGGTAAAWKDVDNTVFFQDATGAHSIATGRIDDAVVTAGADKVAVVDGVVRLQEGSPIAGSGFTSPVSTIDDAFMEPDGVWFARGQNADGVRWVVRNGGVVAASGEPITPGAPERWKAATAFIDAHGSGSGSGAGYVVVGTTDNPDAARDTAAVLSGRAILVREGDPVDLNGNGADDDGLYISRFNDRDTLSADGHYYFAARLRSSATSATGTELTSNSSLLRIRVGAPCPADFDGSGEVDANDISAYLNAWYNDIINGTLAADFDHSGETNANDISAYINAWYAAIVNGGIC